MYCIALGDRGIYDNWNDIKNKKKFIYKKFNTKKECDFFLSKIIDSAPENIDDYLVVFTDGACTNNGKKNSKTGAGVYVPSKNIKLSIPLELKTNNEAEQYAIEYAIKEFKDRKLLIVTDSVVNIYRLWEKENVTFFHIRSHTGLEDFYSKGNNIADELATSAVN